MPGMPVPIRAQCGRVRIALFWLVFKSRQDINIVMYVSFESHMRPLWYQLITPSRCSSSSTTKQPITKAPNHCHGNLRLEPDPHYSQKSLVEAGRSIQPEAYLTESPNYRQQETPSPKRKIIGTLDVMRWKISSELWPGLSSSVCLGARGQHAPRVTTRIHTVRAHEWPSAFPALQHHEGIDIPHEHEG